MARSKGKTVVTDAIGAVHEPAGDGARIVSLVPSITELLFDLGLGHQVVGRTAYCVHPKGLVKAVKSVGGTKTVRFDKLRALDPTHAIVNIDENPKAVADEIAAGGCKVVVTHPMEPRDNIGLFRLMGGLFGRQDEAEALCARFEDAHARIEKTAETLAARRVLYLIWRKPWMTVSADTYITRMLGLVNWHNAGGDGGDRYPTVALEHSTLKDIDVVLFSSEPFPFKEHHLEAFAAQFPGTRAAAIDGQMISWYGSRAIQGLDYLRDLARRLA
jgi:ABC-type Fe3+-hydroxamate transport system substrate-binding protein